MLWENIIEMAKGLFIVSRDKTNPRDILFNTKDGVTELDDEDQLSLRDEIDRTLAVLRLLFKDGDESFEYYFNPILSLAQAGLVGDSAVPKVSKRALTELKNEIVAREGGKVKNRYMKELGKKALQLGLPTFVIATILFFIQSLATQAAFLFLWSGCMAGVWLSFGVRKTVLKYEDLGVIEEDRLEPTMRLIFTGLLTIIIGLLLSTDMIKINIGSVSTTSFVNDIRVSILIGMICGFSEKVLPGKIKEHADKIFGN